MATVIKREPCLDLDDSETETDYESDVYASDVASSVPCMEKQKFHHHLGLAEEEGDLDWEKELRKSIVNNQEFDYCGLNGASSKDLPTTDVPEMKPHASVCSFKDEAMEWSDSPDVMKVAEAPSTSAGANRTMSGTTMAIAMDVAAMKIEPSEVGSKVPKVEVVELDTTDECITDEPLDVAEQLADIKIEIKAEISPTISDQTDIVQEALESAGIAFSDAHSIHQAGSETSVSSSDASSQTPLTTSTLPGDSKEALLMLTDLTSFRVLNMLSKGQRLHFARRLAGPFWNEFHEPPSVICNSSATPTEPKENLRPVRQLATISTNTPSDFPISDDLPMLLQCLKRIQGAERCLYECSTYRELIHHRASHHNEISATSDFEFIRDSTRAHAMYKCVRRNLLDSCCNTLLLDQVDMVNHNINVIHKKELHVLLNACGTCRMSFPNRRATKLHLLRYRGKCGPGASNL